MTIIRNALASLALCFGFAAHASAADYISHQLGVVPPYSGTYIDWSVEGVSAEFDVGPAGSGYQGFFLFHTYDAGGAQINWIGQPLVVPTTEEDRLATGVIARASGSFYYATNGSCLGCAQHPGTVNTIPINYALEWTAPRVMTLTLSGTQTGTFHMVAGNFGSQDDDQFLPGTWAATALVDWTTFPTFQGAGTGLSAYMAVLKVSPAPAGYHFILDPSAPIGSFLPPANARLYSITCPSDSAGKNGGDNGSACNNFIGQMGAGFNSGRTLVAWFDPITKASGIEAATPIGGAYTIGPVFVSHCDLYTTPDALRGHCVEANATNRYKSMSMQWIRLPDAAVRSTFDVPTIPTFN